MASVHWQTNARRAAPRTSRKPRRERPDTHKRDNRRKETIICDRFAFSDTAKTRALAISQAANSGWRRALASRAALGRGAPSRAQRAFCGSICVALTRGLCNLCPAGVTSWGKERKCGSCKVEARKLGDSHGVALTSQTRSSLSSHGCLYDGLMGQERQETVIGPRLETLPSVFVGWSCRVNVPGC